jgi:hypothetical protein
VRGLLRERRVGFWLHRWLPRKASITGWWTRRHEVNRRARRAGIDRLDGKRDVHHALPGPNDESGRWYSATPEDERAARASGAGASG